MGNSCKYFPSPSPGEIQKTIEFFLGDFNPKDMVFLDCKGKWRKTPRSFRERAANELFFTLWKENCQNLLFDSCFSVLLYFIEENHWSLTKKLAVLSLAENSNFSFQDGQDIDRGLAAWFLNKNKIPGWQVGFLIAFEALLWVIEVEALRVNTTGSLPLWKKEEREIQGYFREVLTRKEQYFIAQSGDKDFSLARLLRNVEEAWSPSLSSIIRLLAEEEKLFRLIENYLAKAQQDDSPETYFSLITERIQPEMGIVDRTSPALLRPCLVLLGNSRVPIDSGIPYIASVILSILQDPRSTETLLQSLEKIPVEKSKIRENIIYTLGILKEPRAVPYFVRLLRRKKDVIVSGKEKTGVSWLREQKEEAIWALGKIGLPSLSALPVLASYVSHPASSLKAALAWTLGEIGRQQKTKVGGVSAEIIINLLQLLRQKDKLVFEETVTALKKIELPEFLHALYLFNVGAVNLLGVPPAQRGLYELSESIHALLRQQKRVIIAVNGDSGTGKTYFCQALLEGFGDIKPGEILYLMRDRRRDQKIFNRLLGLRWLKKYIDPVYYEDYPLREEEDDPQEFFRNFLADQADKKLIILDGCRDKYYFQRVIDLLYFNGCLDIVVNFRATLSTRRRNLEIREMALESVKNHLAFLEDPALEDTLYYQEGKILLYDLDNSIPSRLSQAEIRELFASRKIDSWDIFIRPGHFEAPPRLVSGTNSGWSWSHASVEEIGENAWPDFEEKHVPAHERKFSLKVNTDFEQQPCLIASLTLDPIQPVRLSYYASGQVAGQGKERGLFVCSFIGNHLFLLPEIEVVDYTLLRRIFYFIDSKGRLFSYSFERNEFTQFDPDLPPVSCLSALPPDILITGHHDGSVRLWETNQKKVKIFNLSESSITVSFIDYFRRLLVGDAKGTLFMIDGSDDFRCFKQGTEHTFLVAGAYGPGRMLLLSRSNKYTQNSTPCYAFSLVKLSREKSLLYFLPERMEPRRFSAIRDGRVLVSGQLPEESKSDNRPGIFLLDFQGKRLSIQGIFGHERESYDVIAMGPKILTCGEDRDGYHLKIWGAKEYARIEAQKLLIQPD
jgi:HEAT repeat protein